MAFFYSQNSGLRNASGLKQRRRRRRNRRESLLHLESLEARRVLANAVLAFDPDGPGPEAPIEELQGFQWLANSSYAEDGVQAGLEFLGNLGVQGLPTGDADHTNYAHGQLAVISSESGVSLPPDQITYVIGLVRRSLTSLPLLRESVRRNESSTPRTRLTLLRSITAP